MNIQLWTYLVSFLCKNFLFYSIFKILFSNSNTSFRANQNQQWVNMKKIFPDQTMRFFPNIT